MSDAFIIGGTGQVGRQTAARLNAEGWNVVIASRSVPLGEHSWTHAELDVKVPGALPRVLGNGCDLLVSCVAFDRKDAQELLSVQSTVGRIISISSANVYQDDAGRTLSDSASFSGPITEETATVSAGPETYSTRKIAMEDELLNHATTPVTILRPCAIHGPFSKHAREWWFVKRLLDGREQIPLAFGGRSQFQTTSTVAIADAILLAAEGRLPSVANVSDADSPNVRMIGESIMTIMNVSAELVGLSAGAPSEWGSTPWSVASPFVCHSVVDNTIRYAESVATTIEWLLQATQEEPWEQVLPKFAMYDRDVFDYAVDDTALESTSLHE